MNNIKKQPNSFRKAQLLATKLHEADVHSEEPLIIEEYEGDCDRCAQEYQSKVCSMC